MFELDQYDIKALHIFAEAALNIADEFYQPGTSQPRPSVIAGMRSNQNPGYDFRPVDIAFYQFQDHVEDDGFSEKLILCGDENVLTKNVKANGFKDIAYYANGSTAVAFVGLKDDGNSAIIRAWHSQSFGLRDRAYETPLVLQPDKYIDAGRGHEASIAGFLPTISDEKDDSPLVEVYSTFYKILKPAGFSFGTNMVGILPNGMFIHIDPHEGTCKKSVQDKFFPAPRLK